MIRDATLRDLPAIQELFIRSNDAPYDIGLVAEEKCFGNGVAGAPRPRVYDDHGSLRGIAVTCDRFLRILAVDRDYRRQRIGSALLRDSGFAMRVVFAEGGNYFTPGVVESDSASRAFFRRHGFIEARWTSNLVTTDLPGELPSGAERPVNREEFLRFVLREFGAIWRFEAARAFDRDPPTAFWIPNVGFAVHDVNNRGLGTFGPTGVAAAHRRKGHGRTLLLASLADLRRAGYSSVIIPWTDAIEFYENSCGAVLTHRFVTMTHPLR
ncbi:MAG: GNAT family N-acetyltransferase [Thermoanaerobaculia bacterium]